MDNNQNIDKGAPGRSTGNESHPIPGNRTEEKSSIGGAYNSGVTSDDPAEKERIEKQGTMNREQPLSEKEKKAEEDLSNETGSETHGTLGEIWETGK